MLVFSRYNVIAVAVYLLIKKLRVQNNNKLLHYFILNPYEVNTRN